MPPLLIFGGRSTALEIAETARLFDPDREIWHGVGDAEKEVPQEAIRMAELSAYLADIPEAPRFILSMSAIPLRLECLEMARSLKLEPESVLHPQAWVSPTATLGPGTYVAAGARVSCNARVEGPSLINYNVVVGHDTVVGEHAVLNPGACLGGKVQLGDRVLVGSNAFIHQGLQVGADCQIDALTHVSRDLEAGKLCTSRQLRVYDRKDFSNG